MLANCEHCGKEFEKTRGMVGYCSIRCRLYSKTARNDETGCLLYIGATSGNGYGGFQIGKLTTRAHRIIWEIEKGTIPTGMHVLHECDVRKCVEITHLFLGTHQDNMTDMAQKGRGWQPDNSGANCGTSKLTENQVLDIKKRLATGEVQRSIAKDYGLNQSAISEIHTGTTWKNVHLNPVKPDPEHPCSIGPFQWVEEKFPLL